MTRSARSTEVVHPLTSENDEWTASGRSKIENTPSDLQWSSGPGEPPTGGVTGTTPQGPGRRARASAVRDSFQASRSAGLQRRHAAKLQHLARQTLVIPARDLDSALHYARCPDCQRPAELEVSLTTAARLDWHARTTHTDDCTGGQP